MAVLSLARQHMAGSPARLPASHPPARCRVRLNGARHSRCQPPSCYCAAVEAQQALCELGDALMEIRC